jgi:transposase-like protein
VAKYQKPERQARRFSRRSEDDETIQVSLKELILAQLTEWVPDLVRAEIGEFLGRDAGEQHGNDPQTPGTSGKTYRNGYHKERQLTSVMGTFPVKLPRLRVPFESKIIPAYERRTDELGELLPELYMHGLAAGDFRQAMRTLLGENAPISPTTILRLKEEWEQEYKQWRERPLESDYLYLWADGVYPKAGPKDEKMAVLVVVGLNRKGEKEILAIEEGYRESFESWRDLLRKLKRRGLKWAGLMIADGLPGLKKALRDTFPRAKYQRCFLHKMRNCLDKLPTKCEEEAKQMLRDIYNAGSKKAALELKDRFLARFAHDYPAAAKSLEEAGDDLFTYFDFPRTHWKSIKSTNVIESMFNAVKLRTDAARRIKTRKSALFLVFKLLINQESRLHKIRGYRLVARTIDQLNITKLQLKARIAA